MFDTAVVGQRRVVAFLDGVLARGRVPHALLFCGPEGTGKTAAALELARALHCEVRENGACEKCRGCLRTAGLNHPDFSVLFPFSARTGSETERAALLEGLKNPYGYPLPGENTLIGVDRIRDLQRQFSYGTYEGRWRTAVILHADQMRPEAANALLKTLEEPPERSLMVLVASSMEALLPTIVSRCQFVKFPALPAGDAAGYLVSKLGVEAERARFIGRACGGSLRRAREMAESEGGDVQERAFRFLEALIWGEEFKTYAALEQLASERGEVFQVLRRAVVWLEDVLLFLYGRADHVANLGRLEDVERLARAFDSERLEQLLSKVEQLREMSHRNVSLLPGLVSLWRQVRQYAV